MKIQINGVALEYDMAGQGTAFVTVHGGPGMSSRSGDWVSFQSLTDRFKLVSYDQRGCGQSQGQPPYSHEQLVADLEGLRQALGLGRMVLLGGSYGGFVALEYALRHPENLHALVLRDTAASNRFQNTSKERALQSGFPMDLEKLGRLFAGQIRDDEDFRDCYAMIQPLYTVKRDPAEEARKLAQIPFRYQTHNWAFSQNQPHYNLVPRLGEIKVPTLVTVGRHDWITPLEASQEIAAGIPQSELVVFEHSGHAPQVEERELYLQTVRNFLQRRAGL